MLRVEAKGAARAAKDLRKAAERARNPEPALRGAGVELRSAVIDGFRRSEDPSTGKSWAPNSDTTVARKGSSKPLIGTARMRNSISSRVDASKHLVFIGTNVQYAPTHQFGAPEKKIPQRRFLPGNKAGQFFARSGSLAFAAIDRIRQRMLNYIVTGRATRDKTGAPK